MVNKLLIFIAIMVALIAPLFLMRIIYPMGQIFLPEGWIILTPSIRIMCTIIMAVIDYFLAYIFIYFTPKQKDFSFNLRCFILTLLWNIFMGVVWYLVVTS